MSEIAISVDLRSQFGPVRDQGSRPTCLAFAASDTHAALRPGWTPLSCEYAFHHAQRRARRPPDQGATLSSMLDTLREDGQPEELDWSYQASLPADLKTWLPPSRVGPTFRRDGHKATASVSAVLQSLDLGRPMILQLHLSASFYRVGSNGIVDPPPEEVPEPQRRHAVIALAHGSVRGATAVLVRNSWGARWADGGYAWLTERFLAPRLFATALLEE